MLVLSLYYIEYATYAIEVGDDAYHIIYSVIYTIDYIGRYYALITFGYSIYEPGNIYFIMCVIIYGGIVASLCYIYIYITLCFDIYIFIYCILYIYIYIF